MSVVTVVSSKQCEIKLRLKQKIINKMKRNDTSAQFTFHRNIFNSSETNSERNKNKNCRQKLENRFDNEKECSSSELSQKSDRSVLSVLSLNDPRRVFRSGAEKISRTFSNVRTSIGSFSQKFRPSTKRRQLLEEGPASPCVTPQTHSRQILGRTPTKLYSPFGIESPRYISNSSDNKENIPNISKNKFKKGSKFQPFKPKKDLINDCSSPSSTLFR